MHSRKAMLTDRELFFSALRGGRTSFRRLVSRYAHLVEAEVCALLPRHTAYAGSLTEAVFRDAFRHLSRLRKPDHFRQWVVALTRRVCGVTLSRIEESGRHVGAVRVLAENLKGLAQIPSSVSEKAFSPLARITGRDLHAEIARFGKTRQARRVPVRPCLTGPLAGVGGRLAGLRPAARRVFYYHLIAGKPLAEISRDLRISPRTASARLFRCFLALGAVAWNARKESLSSLRRAALLPGMVLGEERALGLGGAQVAELEEKFAHTLRYLELSLQRYRKEAQSVRLTTGGIEQMSLHLPRMIHSARSGYKWNVKAGISRHRFLTFTASAALHVAVLAILTLVIMGLGGRRLFPPRLDVGFRPADELNRIAEIEQPPLIAFPEILQQPRQEKPAEVTAYQLSEEEAVMEMLLKTLQEKSSAAERDLNLEKEQFENLDTERLLEELRRPAAIIDRPTAAAPWGRSPSPGDRSGTGQGKGAQAAASVSEAEEERLERARRWRREAHRKLKEKLEKVRVTTECFTVLQDIPHDKKSAFFSLADARSYVNSEFLEDMFKKVARKCRISADKVRSIWEDRKTTHPKTVRLGILGTRMIEYRTSVWSEADPIFRKRVIEFLIATTHCKIRKVYKEPCSCCAGKGYKLQMSMSPIIVNDGRAPGIRFRKVPCPLCKGLGYELVIVYE